jgi:hypothetical protein
MYCMCQGSVVDPHRFNADPDPSFFLIADPDPVLNPGFRWPKIEEKKFTGEKNGYFFDKNCNLVITRPP